MKFRPNLPMYASPVDEGHPEDAHTPGRENQLGAVDAWGVTIEPGDWVIAYNGETLTISPSPRNRKHHE